MGGVQDWSITVGKQLERMGHTVKFWEPGKPEPGFFDWGIFANKNHTAHLLANCDKTLLVSHGIIDEEEPCDADVVAAVSEEVKEKWGIDGPVIRQPIDVDFWSPSDEPRSGVMRFSYRGGLREAKRAALRLKMPYAHNRRLSQPEALDLIRRSRCVLATGRSALQAMACNIPVVICDHRAAYMEPMMASDLSSQMRVNYSGRTGFSVDPIHLASMIREEMDSGGQRGHVVKHHHHEIITREIVECLKSV